MNAPIDYQHLFISLLEAFPLPVLVVNTRLSICYYNQSALRLFEKTPVAQYTPLATLLGDSAIIQFVQAGIQTGHSHTAELTRSNAAGVWSISVTPLTDQAGAPDTAYHYFAITIEDKAALHHLERMQRDFIANISHELRTPLSSIRLLTETLEEAIDTDHDKAQEFVEKIEIEIRHLNELVSDLLELSRIESGQLPMMIEPIEAEQLVREVMARMLPLAQRHRVTLRTDIQQGKTLVAADSKQITRALVNLVHNAIKFTPSGGTIIIGTTPEVDKAVQRFFVRDTGVGIRPEELPRVFERFYKTSRSRSKTDFIGPGGGGTGLGLAIAQQVVEAHGGHITAASTLGQGSVFTFVLPTTKKSQS
jgi:two-component system, OmpR family, phosphate regulon sensor histidine kinase PhoR